MRIIAGQWRGRALVAPPGETTRPTADRVRQALFDRLMHAPWAVSSTGGALLDGATVLDVFAGTGALGLEALSRGAARASFIEQDRDALDALRANVAACRATAQCRVLAGDARRPPLGQPCDLVFMDPPYATAHAASLAEPALLALRQAGWLKPGGLLLLEAARDAAVPDALGEVLSSFQAGAAAVHAIRL